MPADTACRPHFCPKGPHRSHQSDQGPSRFRSGQPPGEIQRARNLGDDHGSAAHPTFAAIWLTQSTCACTNGKHAREIRHVVANAPQEAVQGLDRFAAKPFLKPIAPPPVANISPSNEGHSREVLRVVASGHEGCPAADHACLKVADRVISRLAGDMRHPKYGALKVIYKPPTLQTAQIQRELTFLK